MYFLLAVVAHLKVTNCARVLTLSTLELTSGKNQHQKCDILTCEQKIKGEWMKSDITARTEQK